MALKLAMFAVFLVAVSGAWAYERGPPVSPEVCTSMYPTGHGYNTATGEAPYKITTGTTTYSAGQTILVTVEASDGTSEIEGVFMQARRRGTGQNGNEAIGRFSNPPENTKLLNCSKPDDAWAQSHELDATAATVTWGAPPCDEGPIAFMATIVKGPKELYWTGVLSAQINFTGANSTDCNKPPPTGRPRRTTPPSKGAFGAVASPVSIILGVVGTLFLAGSPWY